MTVWTNDEVGGDVWSDDEDAGESLRDQLAASDGSSMIGFVQSGTGATNRTVQAKLRDTVSAKDFGAVGDGVTDDTTAIQAAINTQKQVYLPTGRYLVSDTLTFPLLAGSTVRYGCLFGDGASADSTVIAGTNIIGTVIVTPATFAKPLFRFDPSGRQIRLRDFVALGPGKGDASSIAFHFNVSNSDFVFDNIYIDGWESAFQNGVSGGAAGQGNDAEMKFYNIRARNCTYFVRSYNSQSYIWNFFSPFVETTVDTCLKVESSGGFTGNRMQVFGGIIQCQGTIFSLTGAFGLLLCHGTHFEPTLTTATNALVDCGAGANNASIGASFVDCLFEFSDVDYTSTSYWVRMNGSGPLKFDGCQIFHPNAIFHLSAGNLGSGGLGNSASYRFSNNHWRYEPVIIRPDTGLGTQHMLDNNTFLRYNKSATQGVDITKHSGWIPRRIGQPNGTPSTEYFADALPTAGTFVIGDRIHKFTVVAAGSPGWICTANGTFSAATDNTGDTDGSTAVITGVADTSDFIVGEYVTASAGFPSTSTPYKIVALTASTMTLDTNSNSSQSNITVVTVDPVFKTMAVVSA